MAANKGYPYAQYNLGRMLRAGDGIAKDEQAAYGWLLKAAKQGHSGAQFLVGLMLFNGAGVTKNRIVGVEWFARAAEQKHPTAQNNMGVAFEMGYGVNKDTKAAAQWYRQAAGSGSALAHSNLGDLYERGVGVPQDLAEAARWYRKAVQKGDTKAKGKLQALQKRSACQRAASTKVFGLKLKCATRDELRAAIQAAGGKVTREDKKYWYDTYDVSGLVRESKKLSVGYTNAEELARLAYKFPTHMDRNLVERVRNLVARKYGRPHSASGRVSLGEVSYSWSLPDGVKLRVYRGWPSTTTYMQYTIVPAHRKMLREMDQSDSDKKTREFKEQQEYF